MNLKNYTIWDIALFKLTVLAGAFFLISAWSELATWVTNTNWIWFLIAAIVFMIKPLLTTLKK